MARTGEGQQFPPAGGATTTDASLGVLSDHLADDETIVSRLAGTGEITYVDEEGNSHSASTGGDPLAVVTDRRVYLATLSQSGVDVAEIRYRNVREVEATDGLLRRRLSLRVWDDGIYRFKPERGANVTEAAAFVERAARVWQRVLAALESARENVTGLGRHVEAGRTEDVVTAREAARTQLETAADRIENGPAVLRDVLSERVDDVETELQRTRVRAHLARGQSRLEAARSAAADEVWADAEAALLDAQSHADRSRTVAALAGFDVLDAIDRERARIEEVTAGIADQPRQIAADAQVTALAAEEPEDAVPAWASALDGYRAALTFDWGGRLGVDRDTAALRRRVEEAAGNLIAARRDLAEKLRGAAADERMAGANAAASARYEAALSQLSMAESLADELRAGDPAAIADERGIIRCRLTELDAGTDED